MHSWEGLLAVAVLLGSGVLCAQQPAGELRLEVRDPSGAAVEASGRLKNIATGIDRHFQSDPQGQFRFENLPFGRYQLEISKNGFAPQSVTLEIRSEAPVSRRLTLAIGASEFKVDVVETTPLAGVGLGLNEIASPVQAANQQAIQQSGALDLSDFLNQRLNGVHLNEVQGNPFQADLNYRGYTASPLLGTPQGLSVYMDGVRLNQPFGDVVSWDLIPRMAISEVALLPGSNPLFGLNTLGGALSIQTKDGRDHPGATLQVTGGSYGRRAVELEYGGATSSGWSGYVTGNLFHDDGWRQSSPTDVRQSFGKLGWQHGATALFLTMAYAGNTLTGNGLQDQRFLERDYTSVYTKPDITNNHAPSFNISARHSLGGRLTFAGNVYYRYIRADTFNADLNEESLDQSVYQPSASEIAALSAAGYRGFPTSGANASNTPFPSWRCIAQALLHDEVVEKCDGILTHTYSKQHNTGLSGQTTWFQSFHGRTNQLTAGAAYDRSSVGFQQAQQFAYLNPDYSFTPVNAFADGTTNSDGAPYDTRVDLGGLLHTWSLYATDTLSVGRTWNVTLSGRYNRTTIRNRDLIQPEGGPGSLNGVAVFGRFNPAVGFTFNPSRFLNAYASYSEGSRAPTSIELGCADPNQPCKLPNAMAGDPPLRQVSTRTFEAGVRSGTESKLNWSAGWYRAENHNDILFVASTQTGYGYFKNFGQTRRQGVDVSARRTIQRLTLGGGYTFLDATYQSTESLDGSSNSTNDAGVPGLDGIIEVQPGNHIPLIPRHTLKAFADLQATSRLGLDLDLIAVSGSYARGNENNQNRPDNRYYLGPGEAPGYAVVNLGAHYQVGKRIQLFAEINNLLDRRYYTAAQLGPTGFGANGTFLARPFPSVDGEFPVLHGTFLAPGAPRMIRGGLRFHF